jgi:hypothetical protein
MKRIIANVISLAAGLLLCAAASNAQTFKVDVPFEFSVAQKTFPAGQYKIAADVKTHIVALYNAEDRRVLFFAGAPILSPNGGDPGLEFVHLQDGTAYLSEFWIDGSAGYKLSAPKRLPVMAANELASAGTQ